MAAYSRPCLVSIPLSSALSARKSHVNGKQSTPNAKPIRAGIVGKLPQRRCVQIRAADEAAVSTSGSDAIPVPETKSSLSRHVLCCIDNW